MQCRLARTIALWHVFRRAALLTSFGSVSTGTFIDMVDFVQVICSCGATYHFHPTKALRDHIHRTVRFFILRMAADAPLLKVLLISVFLRRGIAFLDGNGWLLSLPALRQCGGEMG